MRGDDEGQPDVFSYIMPEQRVPKDHPLRPVRQMVDAALLDMSSTFARLSSMTGRPSIPPEKLLRALLLQVLYSIRSERMLMEQLDYNLLFRWFVGLNMDDRVWDPTVFTKNRQRLVEGQVDQVFFATVLEQAKAMGLLSNEHFTVDGTLIEAWAGHKSFKPKGKKKEGPPPDDPGNATVNFHGEKRSNETHESTTDPQSRLFRKSNGTESKLCYAGHVLMENRNGLVVSGRLTQATGTAERDAALEMVRKLANGSRKMLGGDKGYDVASFVQSVRSMNVTPHVAAKKEGYSSIDGRTTSHSGYALSQIRRKRVEEIFGWLKTVGGLRKTRHRRGVDRVGWAFAFGLAAYNLVRMRNLAWSP